MSEHSDYQAIDGIGVCQCDEAGAHLGSVCIHDEHSAAKPEVDDIQKAINRSHISTDPELFSIQAQSEVVEKIGEKRGQRLRIWIKTNQSIERRPSSRWQSISAFIGRQDRSSQSWLRCQNRDRLANEWRRLQWHVIRERERVREWLN